MTKKFSPAKPDKQVTTSLSQSKRKEILSKPVLKSHVNQNMEILELHIYKTRMEKKPAIPRKNKQSSEGI